MTPFSVCMSVYRNDKPAEIASAIDSLINQTVPPSEIVLVIDGPVSEGITDLLASYQKRYSVLRLLPLEKNAGLGNALRIAVENASYELIARMDSDDISLPDRFEKQLNCFECNPQLSIVGGSITEFVGIQEQVVGKRECPVSDGEIKKYMKSRCGFNHVAVMFRRSEVLRVGNYQDWHYNEDYYLWLRMMQGGCTFLNLEDVLVNVRVGKDMYARRGGWRYFKSEAKLQAYMRRQKIISFPHFLYNVSVRFVIQVIMPNSLRAWIFQKLLRS